MLSLSKLCIISIMFASLKAPANECGEKAVRKGAVVVGQSAGGPKRTPHAAGCAAASGRAQARHAVRGAVLRVSWQPAFVSEGCVAPA